ncbi:Transcription factor [Penicillium solitum]|uniref:Transcription factor n=1 Tax=Penicillium solitum TaxID=60172 RepID=UPI0032C42561|nr:Transcription factor [Penicillium solitum]
MDVVRACLQAGQSSGIAFTGSPGLGLEKETVFLKFKPHERAVFEDGQGRGPTCGSRFGAEIITRSIQWAKLGGSVVNLLAMDGSVHKKQEIRSSLGTWWLDAHEHLACRKYLSNSQPNPRNEFGNQYNEVSVSTFSLILLLKGVILRPFWSSVYNGAVWQLLYCPFTPFFVIFGNIIYSDGAQTSAIAQDLNLLPATVDYFAHTASVFLQLAQGHVPHHALTETIEKQAKAFQSQPEEHMGRRDQGPKFPVDLHLGEFNVAKYFERLPTEMSPMVYI